MFYLLQDGYSHVFVASEIFLSSSHMGASQDPLRTICHSRPTSGHNPENLQKIPGPPNPTAPNIYTILILWALKYIHTTYVGLFGALGKVTQKCIYLTRKDSRLVILSFCTERLQTTVCGSARGVWMLGVAALEGSVDDLNPALASIYYTTILPTVMVYEVMQDFNQEQR